MLQLATTIYFSFFRFILVPCRGPALSHVELVKITMKVNEANLTALLKLNKQINNSETNIFHCCNARPSRYKGLSRCVKFPQNLLALIVKSFHLDAKNEEIVKKVLKILLALPSNLLANASGRVEFYTPAVPITGINFSIC